MPNSIYSFAAAGPIAALLMAMPAAAVTVINGGFESGIALSGQAYVPGGDTTSITGWRATGGGVNYTPSTVWDAASGSRSVGFTSYGGVAQKVSGFTPGKTYKMTFSLSADPFGADGDKTVLVSATGGVAQLFTYTKTAANSPTNMLYAPYVYTFTASGVLQNIMLRGLTSHSSGFAVVDNVSVTLVPEPAMWGLMIAGFAMVGVAARRRRTSVAA